MKTVVFVVLFVVSVAYLDSVFVNGEKDFGYYLFISGIEMIIFISGWFVGNYDKGELNEENILLKKPINVGKRKKVRFYPVSEREVGVEY